MRIGSFTEKHVKLLYNQQTIKRRGKESVSAAVKDAPKGEPEEAVIIHIHTPKPYTPGYKRAERPFEKERTHTAPEPLENEPATDPEENAPPEEEQTPSLPGKIFKKDENEPLYIRGKNSSVTDDALRLTRRLVASKSRYEVYDILSEAYKNLGTLRTMAMGTGEDAARARVIIKKLEKLIKRGQRKISDLNKEDSVRMKQRKAERDKKQERVKEIKAELRKMIRARKKRENAYLRDRELYYDGSKEAAAAAKLSAALEAKIEALAQQMAGLEADQPGSAAGDAATGAEASADGAQESAGGSGGEGAPAEGSAVSPPA